LAEGLDPLLTDARGESAALQYQLGPSPIAVTLNGVSAAEWFVFTHERVAELEGKIALVYNHGNFSDKHQLSWGYHVRQVYQPAHTQLVTCEDMAFVQFIERNGPVPV